MDGNEDHLGFLEGERQWSQGQFGSYSTPAMCGI